MTEAEVVERIEETATFLAGTPQEFKEAVIADAMSQIAQKHSLAEMPPSVVSYAAAVLRRTHELEAAMGDAQSC